jgi:hypothetical protein
MFARVINKKIQKYPFSLNTLIAENPNTSFPKNLQVDFDCLAQYNVYRVFPSIKPEIDSNTQKLLEDSPRYDDESEQWIETWKVIDLTPEEKEAKYQGAAAEVKSKRNDLLSKSDWTQLPDSGADKQQWAVYRQALREVSSQAGFPFNVVWPSKPL